MKDVIRIGTSNGLYKLGSERGFLLEGHEVRSLVQNSSCWWAIIDDNHIWHSEGDDQWEEIGSVDGLKANCLFPAAHGLLIGTSEAHLFLLTDRGPEPVRSFDETTGRSQWYTPWGGAPDVRSATTGPGGTLFVNVHVGGVLRSRGDVGTWEPTLDKDMDVHQVLFDEDTGWLFAASASGLAVSKNEGRSWNVYTDGLHGKYLRAVGLSGGQVLVTASTGPRTRKSALYRKPVRKGCSFIRCEEGLPNWFEFNIDTFCLGTSDTRAVFGTPDGSVYHSEDAGKSWTLLASDLPPVLSVALGQG